eukprot:scaffold219369_cov34-Tisochrysis_lutea.AAC.2
MGTEAEDMVMPTSPRYSFRERFKSRAPDSAFQPGPADYDKPSTSRGPAHAIGKSSHPKPFNPDGIRRSVFISKEHSEENKGVYGPGPITISNPGRGSRERRAPSFSFGTDERFG